jgi:hypothetical protein
MWEKLEPIFQELELPYSRQGSYEEDEDLPESFFTFWNMNTPESGFYDNHAHKAVWFWAVYFYTKNPALIYSKLDEFIKLAKEKGFISEGRGHDVASGVPDYSGRYIIVKYIDDYEEN